MEPIPPNYNSISDYIIKEEDANLDEQIAQERRRRCRIRWKPTSMLELRVAEKKLLSYVTLPYETKTVIIGDVHQPSGFCRSSKLTTIKISTVVVNPSCTNPKLPIVLFHGLSLGKGSWCYLLNEVAKERTVYAMDLPGFGRSTRLQFPKDAAEAEMTYLNILEAWRKAFGLQKFTLIGYSFGGFLATCYALNYPQRVHHLIALDPWGYPEKPKKVTVLVGETNPFVIWIMQLWTKRVNLFAIFRILGPIGRPICDHISNETFKAYQRLGDGMHEAMNSFAYHSLAKKTRGETAFRRMGESIVYAKHPLCRRLHLLDSSIPVTIFHPETSYVPAIPEEEFRSLFSPESIVRVVTLPSTNHDDMVLSSDLAMEILAIN